MFNTIFDMKLEDFFYGETCTSENFGYARKENAKGFNFSKNKISIPVFALGAITSAVMLTGSTNFGVSINDALGKGRLRIPGGITSGPSKLDERGRQDLVRKLSRIRDDFGLTQEQMADLLGISKSTISKMERGEHYPDISNMARYKSFLDLADYLNQKLNNKKYAIRQLFKLKSQVFDGMTPIEFAHTIGEEGLNEVIYSFKRQYG